MRSRNTNEEDYINKFDRTKKLRLDYDFFMPKDLVTQVFSEINSDDSINSEQIVKKNKKNDNKNKYSRAIQPRNSNQKYDQVKDNQSYESYSNAVVTPLRQENNSMIDHSLSYLTTNSLNKSSLNETNTMKQTAKAEDINNEKHTVLKAPDQVEKIQAGQVKILGLPDWMQKKTEDDNFAVQQYTKNAVSLSYNNLNIQEAL